MQPIQLKAALRLSNIPSAVVALSMALMMLLRFIPFGSLLIGETPRPVRIAFHAIFRGRTGKTVTPVPLASDLP